MNYDLSGRGTTVLRGGVGLFAGPPAYVWFRNVYGTTGARALSIECEAMPCRPLRSTRQNQPTACAEPSPGTFRLAYFDPEFRFPQNPEGGRWAPITSCPAASSARWISCTPAASTPLQVVDVNLAGPVGVAAGEGGRALYGTIDPATGEAQAAPAVRRPAWRVPAPERAAAIARTRSPPSSRSASPTAPS